MWSQMKLNVKSDEIKKILYKDANNLYGWAMSECLPYDEIRFDNNVKLKDIKYSRWQW